MFRCSKSCCIVRTAQFCTFLLTFRRLQSNSQLTWAFWTLQSFKHGLCIIQIHFSKGMLWITSSSTTNTPHHILPSVITDDITTDPETPLSLMVTHCHLVVCSRTVNVMFSSSILRQVALFCEKSEKGSWFPKVLFRINQIIFFSQIPHFFRAILSINY